jgi:putative oxidoreductase
MKRIEIDEYPPAKSITFSQTLLRCAVGAIMLAHGVNKLHGLAAYRNSLIERFGMLDAEVLAYGVIALELAAGAGLIFGWFTRSSAFFVACSSAFAFALEYLRTGFYGDRSGFELPVLLFTAGLVFLFAGGGRLSLDVVLRERARRKAIQNDDLWLYPPYVGAARDSWAGYGDDDDYDFPEDAVSAGVHRR